MKKVFVCWIVSLVSLASVSASKPRTYQQATVLKGQEVDTQPTYVGSNPSDAPMSPPTYSYKVWLRVDCVTHVARYDSWSDQPDPMFSPTRMIAGYALDALSSAPTIRAINAGGLSLLSHREQQVVHYLAEGLTNREIGAQLGLSRHTIKNYLLKIFDKLGVSNRTELLFLTLSQPSPAAQFPQVAEDAKKV